MLQARTEVLTTDIQRRAAEVEDLHAELQRTWQDYLKLLDQYTACQQLIQRHFSAGFFSLAQANARTTVGRRYGRDWYDDRTKATVGVGIADRNEGPEAATQYLQLVVRTQHARPDDVKPETSTPGVSTSPQDNTNQDEDGKQPAAKAPDAEPEDKQQRDPLQWFGLLAPPVLRNAQKSFKMTVLPNVEELGERQTPPIEAAVNAARGMRELEVRIRRLRKSIRQAERSTKA